MELNIYNKYKDRLPLETVEIIHNFFLSKGFSIKIKKLAETECGTWGCIVALFIDDYFIFSQNGKGVTKEYALASGYAELFERFNNKLGIYLNPLIQNKVLSNNFNKKNYYISPSEQIASKEEIYFEFKTYFDALFTNKKEAYEYINTVCQFSPLKVPFKNYLNEEKKYYDPRIITHIMMSSGLSAGNSLEEALVQGMSEIFEHYAGEKFFKGEINQLYEINQKILPNYLQNIIDKICNNGNEIKIFDLSYNTNVPVIMSVLFNKFSYNFHINFAGAPIFEIAVERTLTELYQNKFTYLSIDKINCQEPFDINNWAFYYSTGFQSFARLNCIPDKLLLNSKKIDFYNKEIFYKKKNKISNKNFIEHYYQICKETLNSDIYYINNSPIKNMYALQIYCPNLDFKNNYPNIFQNLSNEEKTKLFICYMNYYKALFSLENMPYDEIQLNNFLNLVNTSEISEYMEIFGYLMGSDWFYPFPKGQGYQSKKLFEIFQSGQSSEILLFSDIATLYRPIAREYCTALNYINDSNYSQEEKKSILKMLGIHLDIDYIIQNNSNLFAFYNIFIKTIQNNLNSSIFKTFINAYSN